DLRTVLLGEEVVGDVVAVERVLRFGGRDEHVLGAGDLVGDGVGVLLELRERLGEHGLVFDREVVQPVHHASRCHRGAPSSSLWDPRIGALRPYGTREAPQVGALGIGPSGCPTRPDLMESERYTSEAEMPTRGQAPIPISGWSAG